MSEGMFVERQKELFSSFKAGDMNEVLALIQQIKLEFPERLEKIRFWETCAYSILGKAQAAVAALQEGLKEGIWWNPYILTADPDLRNLQTHDGFKKIVEQCEEIFSTQKENATCELFVYGNRQSEIGILCMHARGTNVKDSAPYWLHEKDEQSYLFGFPQSSQVFGYQAYCWDDQEIALKEVEQAHKEFHKVSHIRSQIIGGASQGGKLAIELSLSKALPGIKGFIAVMPAIKNVAAIEALLKENDYSDLKGYIIIGDQDPFYQNTLDLMAILKAKKIDCQLIVKEGLGHFFPDDFSNMLTEAVAYIVP